MFGSAWRCLWRVPCSAVASGRIYRITTIHRVEFLAMYRRFETSVTEQHKIGCTTMFPRLLFHWNPAIDYGGEEVAAHVLDPTKLPPHFPIHYGRAHYLFESLQDCVTANESMYNMRRSPLIVYLCHVALGKSHNLGNHMREAATVNAPGVSWPRDTEPPSVDGVEYHSVMGMPPGCLAPVYAVFTSSYIYPAYRIQFTAAPRPTA